MRDSLDRGRKKKKGEGEKEIQANTTEVCDL